MHLNSIQSQSMAFSSEECAGVNSGDHTAITAPIMSTTLTHSHIQVIEHLVLATFYNNITPPVLPVITIIDFAYQGLFAHHTQMSTISVHASLPNQITRAALLNVLSLSLKAQKSTVRMLQYILLWSATRSHRPMTSSLLWHRSEYEWSASPHSHRGCCALLLAVLEDEPLSHSRFVHVQPVIPVRPLTMSQPSWSCSHCMPANLAIMFN